MSNDLTIDQLQEFLKKAGDYAGRDEALRLAFLEVGLAMGEVLDLLSKQTPQAAESTAKAIADALRGMKPEVRMDFKPEFKPEFRPEFKPQITVPAAAVTVMPAERSGGWTFDFDVSTPGRISGTCHRID